MGFHRWTSTCIKRKCNKQSGIESPVVSMSVWSDSSYSTWANKGTTVKGKQNKWQNSTSYGAFGSQKKFGNSGSTSLPSFDLRKKNSNLYKFELSSNFSTSYCSLGFDIEAKPYDWNNNMSTFKSSAWNSASKISSWTDMPLSGGSSRCSSGNVSMDWNLTVDGVFLEEIQIMSDGLKK